MTTIKAGRNANRAGELAPSDGTPGPVMSRRADQFVETVAELLASAKPRDIAAKIRSVVAENHRWRREECLNLCAAENTISRRARGLLDFDLATRVSEGFPGDKEFPPPRMNESIDWIEATIIHLARRLYGARFVEWRPVSTTMALAMVFSRFGRAGDTMLVQSLEGGGNLACGPDGPGALQGLRIAEIPANQTFEIDLDAARRAAHACRPRLIVIGGSYLLFPYPVTALRAIADEVGALLVYDGAHVALGLADGSFQSPLAEGAHLVCVSTHKIAGGPVGGLVLTDDPRLIRELYGTAFPAFMQTRDQNKLAATAHALAEMTEFGAEYNRQCVANARALAGALRDRGFVALGADRRYTATHQLFLDFADADVFEPESRWQRANILVHAAHMSGDTARGRRSGVRISVQEVTRTGMREPEMAEVARLMAVAAADDAGGGTAALEAVKGLARRFQRIQFSYDD